MATKLYVGGLAYSIDDNQLKDFFASAGTVVSAQVITDRDSNQSKGFGFVEMSTEEEAKKAIADLNGKEIDGRAIVVNEARPQAPRPAFGGGSRGSFGGNRDRTRRRF